MRWQLVQLAQTGLTKHVAGLSLRQYAPIPVQDHPVRHASRMFGLMRTQKHTQTFLTQVRDLIQYA